MISKTIPIKRSIKTAFTLKLSIKLVPAKAVATKTYQDVSMIPAITAIMKRPELVISEFMN